MLQDDGFEGTESCQEVAEVVMGAYVSRYGFVEDVSVD